MARYWIGGTGNWTDTAHWDTVSGGGGGAAVPTSADATFFDANSGFTSGSHTITINGVNAKAKSMDFTGSSVAPVMTITSGDVEIFGDLKLITGMSWATNTITFTTTGTTCNLTSAGVSFNLTSITINGTGTFNLLDDLAISTGIDGRLQIQNSTFNTNNHNINPWTVNIDLSGTTVNLGSSIITFQGNSGNHFDILNTGVVFNAGTSLIKWPAINTQNNRLAGAGKTFNNVEFDTNAAFPVLIIGSNTFNNFTVAAGAEIDFTRSTTQTITTLNAVGTSPSHIKFRSDLAGTQYSLCVTTWNIAYLDVKDMNASCATLTNCTGVDSGNNTGVDFCLGRAFLLNML